MTKEQCIAERNNREMILHSDWWPVWPELPLKRAHVQPQAPDSIGHLGVLLDGPGLTVYLTLMGFPITRDTPRLEYATVEDLLADGWVVD